MNDDRRKINAEYISPGKIKGRKLVGEISDDQADEVSVEFVGAPAESAGGDSFLRRLVSLWQMLKDKDYRTSTIFRTMLVLLPIWVISPIDPIPDFFFGVGLLDDLFAIMFTLGIVGREIDNYRMRRRQGVNDGNS